MSINTVIIIGRLGHDPEQKITESGLHIATFSLAFNEIRLIQGKKKTITHWFKCVTFESLAQLTMEYLTEGCQIAISGSLRQNTWEDETGTKKETVEILVKDIEFLATNRGHEE